MKILIIITYKVVFYVIFRINIPQSKNNFKQECGNKGVIITQLWNISRRKWNLLLFYFNKLQTNSIFI